jgi:hypothetical protein
VRVFIEEDPYTRSETGIPWNRRGTWPCRWIGCAGAGAPPFAVAFRNRFTLSEAATVRVHVSADERYELFLNGERDRARAGARRRRPLVL